jgi:NAD(P)-dependent dehydrogenase (short-subunit alcohol dehydrogenase family)
MGWRVLATMRRPERETELIMLAGVKLMRLDITDSTQIEEAAALAISTGTVDVVFNNAGYGMSGPLEGVTDEQVVRMVETNLIGPIRMTKAFVSYFRQRGRGLFINTTSIGGLIAVPFNSIYHATKWGLEGVERKRCF